jgi:hypothetical protein
MSSIEREYIEDLNKTALDASSLYKYCIKPQKFIRLFQDFHEKLLKDLMQDFREDGKFPEEDCKFLDSISMKKLKAKNSETDMLATKECVEKWSKKQYNLAKIFIITGENAEDRQVTIETCGNEGIVRNIGVFLAKKKKVGPEDELVILKFIRGCHARPIDLVAPEHTFKGNIPPQLLRPGALFYCKQGETRFEATLAGNREFPDIDKTFLHNIPSSSLSVGQLGGQLEEWIKAVKSSIRFRKLSDGYQIAFAMSTFAVVSSWAAANYPVHGKEGDKFKRQFKSGKFPKDTSVKPFAVIEAPSSDGRDPKPVEIEWSKLQAYYESFTDWVCFGPGSYRFRKPDRDWTPGRDWIGSQRRVQDHSMLGIEGTPAMAAASSRLAWNIRVTESQPESTSFKEPTRTSVESGSGKRRRSAISEAHDSDCSEKTRRQHETPETSILESGKQQSRKRRRQNTEERDQNAGSEDGSSPAERSFHPRQRGGTDADEGYVTVDEDESSIEAMEQGGKRRSCEVSGDGATPERAGCPDRNLDGGLLSGSGPRAANSAKRPAAATAASSESRTLAAQGGLG